MKRLTLLAAIALICSCKFEKRKRVVIGKDVSFSKYGTQYHHLYFKDGERSVKGSVYYNTKVGDTVEIEVLTAD